MLKKAFALFLLSATPAFAAKDCARSFESAARALPAKLARLGYHSVASININNLVVEMAQVAVKGGDQKKIMAANRDGRSNGRATARWEVDANGASISVACAYWGQLPSKDVLSLHEFFGALGYPDQDYRVSVSFWLLAHPVVQARFTEAQKEKIVDFVRTLGGRQQFAGGVVGVGGGGEGMSVLYRIRRLERELDQLNAARTEEERQAALRDIEVAFSSSGTFYVGPI
ncbi:MAG: hypothetical protein EOP11_04170 [Proteobacteria bacterium]|nr:MAG: hypothetical protein EOP11_04170 [Pseudomonadota bacterium]